MQYATTASLVTAIKERCTLKEPSVCIRNMEHSHSTEESFRYVVMMVQPACLPEVPHMHTHQGVLDMYTGFSMKISVWLGVDMIMD